MRASTKTDDSRNSEHLEIDVDRTDQESSDPGNNVSSTPRTGTSSKSSPDASNGGSLRRRSCNELLTLLLRLILWPVAAAWFTVVSMDYLRLRQLFKQDVADESFKLVECPLVREQELLHTSAVFLFSAGLVANFLTGSPWSGADISAERKWRFQAFWGVVMLLTLSALLCSYTARTGIFKLWGITRDYVKQLRQLAEAAWQLECPADRQPALLMAAKCKVARKLHKRDKLVSKWQTFRDVEGATSNSLSSALPLISPKYRDMLALPHLDNQSANTHMEVSGDSSGGADSSGKRGVGPPVASSSSSSAAAAAADTTQKKEDQSKPTPEIKSQVVQAMWWIKMEHRILFTIRVLSFFLTMSRLLFGLSLILWLATIQYAVFMLGGGPATDRSNMPGHVGGWVVFVMACLMELVAVFAVLCLVSRGLSFYNSYHTISEEKGGEVAGWVWRPKLDPEVAIAGDVNQPVLAGMEKDLDELMSKSPTPSDTISLKKPEEGEMRRAVTI